MFERLVELLGQAGYIGIAALMFLENLFPPIPSEVIMPSAVFSAGQSKLNLAGVGLIVVTYLYRVATWRAN